MHAVITIGAQLVHAVITVRIRTKTPSLRPLSSMKGAQNNLCAISTPVLKWSDLTSVIIFVQSKGVYKKTFNHFLTFLFLGGIRG